MQKIFGAYFVASSDFMFLYRHRSDLYFKD